MKTVESINGTESIEDLIAMVDRQDDTQLIIQLISLTTAKRLPSTYNQFVKKLKKERPIIFLNFYKTFNFEEEIKKDKTRFKISNFFKSDRNKVIEKLNEVKLNAFVRLLHSIQIHSLGNLEELKEKECVKLKEKSNYQKKDAEKYLNAFRWAKDICEEHNYSVGANSMQYYVDVYSKYLKEYIVKVEVKKTNKNDEVFKLDDSFEYCNNELNLDFKNQYDFIKSIRSKALKGEITSLEMLENAIKTEYKEVKDPITRNEKAEKFRLIENKIGAYLILSDKNRNNIIGFEDIEQFHTISTKAFEALHNIENSKEDNNKICSNCGNNIEKSKFCSKCGEKTMS